MADEKALQVYRAIQALWGMEEFKAFADKLVLTAENAARQRILYPPLPNLIFAINPGVGVTKHLHLLTGLLKGQKLMRFSGEQDFFEMTFRDPEADFERVLNSIKIAAGFYGSFRGVVGLDFSWLFRDKQPFKGLEKLKEFIDYQYGRILFVFIIPLDAEQRMVDDFIYQFTSYSPIELIHMPFPETKDVMAFIHARLSERNFKTTPDADKLLTRAVDDLRTDGSFEGFQTLNNLIDAIVWNKLSRRSEDAETLTAADLTWIYEEDKLLGLVRSKLRSGPYPRRIGFAQEG